MWLWNHIFGSTNGKIAASASAGIAAAGSGALWSSFPWPAWILFGLVVSILSMILLLLGSKIVITWLQFRRARLPSNNDSLTFGTPQDLAEQPHKVWWHIPVSHTENSILPSATVVARQVDGMRQFNLRWSRRDGPAIAERDLSPHQIYWIPAVERDEPHYTHAQFPGIVRVSDDHRFNSPDTAIPAEFGQAVYVLVVRAGGREYVSQEYYISVPDENLPNAKLVCRVGQPLSR
jgi:hypothetical protein